MFTSPANRTRALARFRLLGVAIAGCCLAGCTAEPAQDSAAPATAPATAPAGQRFTFNEGAPGPLPDRWRAAATGEGALGEWRLISDSSATSPPGALALVASTHGIDQTYNLCLTEAVRFGDGRLSVRVKANEGVVDQGGGPVWRVRDEDNYYVCRANPLESNFRLYVVEGGRRRQLASAAVQVPAGQWLRIEVEHVGNRILCTLNGTTRIEATDNTLPEAGGVGLWTKADALTAFDDLVVEPAR